MKNKWTRISLSTNDPDKVIEAINSTGALISDYAISEPQTKKNNSTAEIARLFHDTYERLAPEYGYKTREDTKVFDPTSQNGRLMIAVCNEVLAQALHQERLRLIGEIEREVLITPEGKATVLIVGQEKDGKLINKHEVQADRLFMEALYEKQCKKLAEYKV